MYIAYRTSGGAVYETRTASFFAIVQTPYATEVKACLAGDAECVVRSPTGPRCAAQPANTMMLTILLSTKIL